MPDDWSWFWAGENGRDNLLRDELEGLQSRAFEASQQSARLSSQLRTLQGSLESRLQALSTAFDAYVELGDVREQLAGYPDTSAVRRASLRALLTLDAGGVPDPLAAGEVDYWLVGATNEVVALVTGSSAPAPSDGPADGPPDGTVGNAEHETFVVAALGWLGHGERVAERVAPLLLADGALAAPQVVLWRAAAHGRYPGALPGVEQAWSRDLDLTAETWRRFAADTAKAVTPLQTVRWIQLLVQGGWSPTVAAPSAAGERSDARATTDPDEDRTALRRVVEALVGAGLGDERVLLERARVLRARIEDPGAAEPDAEREPPRTPTTALVQEALLDPRVDADARRTLVGWVRPGLDAAVTAIAAEVAAQRPGPQAVHTEIGSVTVTADGADPARLAELDAHAVQSRTRSRAAVLVPAVGAGVALLAGLALLRTAAAGLGVTLLLAVVVLVVVVLREVVRTRRGRVELEEVRARTRQRVEEGRQAAVTAAAEDLATKAEVATLARSLTGQASLR